MVGGRRSCSETSRPSASASAATSEPARPTLMNNSGEPANRRYPLYGARRRGRRRRMFVSTAIDIGVTEDLGRRLLVSVANLVEQGKILLPRPFLARREDAYKIANGPLPQLFLHRPVIVPHKSNLVAVGHTQLAKHVEGTVTASSAASLTATCCMAHSPSPSTSQCSYHAHKHRTHAAGSRPRPHPSSEDRVPKRVRDLVTASSSSLANVGMSSNHSITFTLSSFCPVMTTCLVLLLR